MSTFDPGPPRAHSSYPASRGATPYGSARRPKHRRKRRHPLALLGGLVAIALGAGALVIRLPSPGEGEDGDTTLSAPEKPAESPAASSPSPEEEPVLLRSVVEEVNSGSGEMGVVEGESETAGDGPTMRYLVEVEKDLPGKAADFAAAVEEILGDERGWTGDGERSFQRVDSREKADFRVTLAAPETVDTLCAPLSTNGHVSCTTGGRAVINQNRWVGGVDHFDGDLGTYRVYVINHEVGHVLGRGHVDCPGDGETAPVMQQQTLRLDGCEPNGWVHP